MKDVSSDTLFIVHSFWSFCRRVRESVVVLPIRCLWFFCCCGIGERWFKGALTGFEV